MNAPVSISTLDPSDVHRGEPLFGGSEPIWERRERQADDPYDRSGYRCCSYCGSIHPEDMIELLRNGGARLEGTTKAYKRYLILPNPIAGQDVVMGSSSGPTHEGGRFVGDGPRTLRTDMEFTLQEIEAGRFRREHRGAAPAEIQQKFYMDHTTREQWSLVVAAATGQSV